MEKQMPTALMQPDPAARSRVLTSAVTETARHLDIGSTELSRIIGLSQPVASRLLNGRYAIKESTKEWELAALFVRLYRGLFSIVGNSDQLAKDWLRSPNRAFGDQYPVETIKSVQGLVRACEYIDAHRASV
jgi:uncharacterized protein (DUF2384 family)